MKWISQNKSEYSSITLAIRSFWVKSDLHPTCDFYPDPEGKNRYTVCSKAFTWPQDLKAHRTRKKHYDDQQHKKTRTSVVDAITVKRNAQQKLLPKVNWNDEEAENQWHSKYLGFIFEAGGGQMTDVKVWIARAKQRFGNNVYIYCSNLLR